MDEMIPISIAVGDRNYRIRVEPRHEETVRKSAQVLQQKVAELKQQFAGQDMQDYVAMALIWFATQKAADMENRLLDDVLTAGIRRLESQIDEGIAQYEARG
jgi:cell division protein ZapA